MATPYIGEVKLVSFPFAMKGWAFCNGQILSIAQNQALFSILGTTYGGNGVTNFALPNLQGRTPMGTGNGYSMSVELGESSGTENVTLTISQLPAHNHLEMASVIGADNPDPTNAFLATPTDAIYASATSLVELGPPTTIGLTGGSQPHNNMQPYLVLNFLIALVGVYPSQG